MNLIEQYKNRHKIRKEYSILNRKVSKLKTKLSKLYCLLNDIKGISFIKNNLAISRFNYNNRIVYHQIFGTKYAEVYLNAHNNTTYGIRLYDGPSYKPKWYAGKWLGSDFSLKYARKLAIDFVANLKDY